MTDTSSRHIATIPKNRSEELRVTVDLFKGHQLLNLRVWFTGDDGAMRPGKQGVAVRLDLAADLASAIGEAAQ